MRHAILFSDGTMIRSGQNETVALRDVKVTQCVNAGTELTVGSVCAGMLEATIFAPDGAFSPAVGSYIALYRLNAQDYLVKVGEYFLEKVIHPSKNLCRIVAYDAISRLDKDLSQWLAGLQAWPYPLGTFAEMVCQECEVTLQNKDAVGDDWEVQMFTPGRVTGRQLMQWIGQACGRFCRATVDGKLEFAWYVSNYNIEPIRVGQDPVFQLDLASYMVAPVSKIQICQSEYDMGITYGAGNNLYRIVGNPLLRTESSERLQGVVSRLYDILSNSYYKPCKITLPIDDRIRVGDIIPLIDNKGDPYPVYVMKKVRSGNLQTLECTGSARRSDSMAVNSGRASDAYGRMMYLEMDLDGLKVENRNGAEKSAALELTVDGIKSQVFTQQEQLSDVTGRLSVVEQDAEGLSVKVRSITEDGAGRVTTTTGYTFDEDGITIRKSGREIKTQITEDGMTVYKNNNAVLTANSAGVDAVDLHASTYLIVGGRSRFENYGTDRTGCFWIGG